MTCTFCNIPYDDPLDVYGTKPIDALLEAARIAISDERQPAHHMLISGGTPKRPDFGFMQELYQRVLLEFPHTPGDIMMVPLPGLLDLPLLDKLGLNEISINIEVFSETHAMQVMRHKYNQGLDFYLDFIEQAAEALGPGRVRSMLMIGLEPMEAALAGVAVGDKVHPPRLGVLRPKLPSLCVDIRTLTCDNAEESKVFLHRKSATVTGYHDGSLRWSDNVARRHDLRAREGPGQRREWRATAK